MWSLIEQQLSRTARTSPSTTFPFLSNLFRTVSIMPTKDLILLSTMIFGIWPFAAAWPTIVTRETDCASLSIL
jgi:hypothetical protein